MATILKTFHNENFSFGFTSLIEQLKGTKSNATQSWNNEMVKSLIQPNVPALVSVLTSGAVIALVEMLF